MTDNGKRYFGIIWPKKHATQAALLAGYERDSKVIVSDAFVGFALDYYPEEKVNYKKEYGDAIIGDFITRAEAEAAIHQLLNEGDVATTEEL